MTVYRDPPSIDDMVAIADEAFEGLPAEFRELVRGVAITVVDFPDEQTLAEMECQTPFDLLGLYQGIPFGEADGFAIRQDVDRILLYRRPILDYWCDTGEDLVHVVRHVLIHEIGHHFGLSDEDMDAIEQAAEAEAQGER
jgi:predicted Zn-dependent protease with MMP-like domain